MTTTRLLVALTLGVLSIGCGPFVASDAEILLFVETCHRAEEAQEWPVFEACYAPDAKLLAVWPDSLGGGVVTMTGSEAVRSSS